MVLGRWGPFWIGLTVVVLSGCVDDGADGRGLAIGRQGILARGTVAGTDLDWVLEASVDGDSLCLEFLGTSCIAVPKDSIEQPLLVSTGTDARRSHSCAYGPLFREATRVRVEFADGTKADGRVVPGQGWATNFYVACIGRDVGVRKVVLFDADGARLESAT